MKIRWIVLASLVTAALAVLLLLLNHRHAVVTARSIIVSDNNGNDVSAGVANLTTFVHSHMRTGVSFELAAGYDRAVEAAKAAAQPNVNTTVYAQAQAACKQKVATVQTQCITTYVNTHAAPAQAGPVTLPERSQFIYTLQSPAWTPDAPGLLFVAAAGGLLVATWLKFMSPRHHS